MKYAIYDKAADGYLTKMEFEMGYSDNTQFECGLNEYITEAKLLDTPKEAADAIARIESFKFMEKGRFVIHSFDDTLKDQYIISEAGNPTKVIESITVDLDGTINVKYGTMISHWSTTSLEYAITRMNALQKAKSPKYTSWCNTFDIYRVIPVIDERSCGHYQFIKVTEKGLTEYAKNEVDPLNKRIEDLEKANNILTEDINYHNGCRIALAEMIRAIKYAICSKDGDKRDTYISYMTDKIKDDEIFNRPELKTTKNDIPKICKYLTALAKNPLNKRIEELEKANYELGERVAERGTVANRLLDENNSLKTKVESIKKEARDWKKLYKNADADREELKNAIDIIHADLLFSTACDDLKDTLKTINCNSGLDHISMGNFITAKDEIRSIISHVIAILESRELNQSVAFSSAEEVDRAKKLANDIINICEATTDPFEVTLKKFSQLYEAVNDPGDDDDTIMYAFKGVLEIFSSLEDHVKSIIDESVTWKNKAQKAEKKLEDQKKLNDANKATIAYLSVKKMANDKELSDWKQRAEDAIRDYKNCNEALGEWKRKYRAMQGERDNALERAEKFKGIANSVYGITIPGRCCGKQVMTDILNGKKISISKDRYDDLVECVNIINITYDILKCADFTMNKPLWFDGIINRIKNLTE